MPETMIPEAVVLVTEPLADDAVGRWQRLIDDAAEMRPDRLVVDLGGADHIDEVAVVMLLQEYRRLTIAGGRLILRSPNARVRDMLSHGRVDRVLDIEESPLR
jgi:anti-anti-sigma factor